MDGKSKLIPVDKYRDMMDVAPIATVDVLFFNKNKDKTLLFRRTNKPLKGIYFSIGGRLSKGETFIECALRQAKSELGITLDHSKLVFGSVQEEIHPDSSFPGISYHAVDLFYGYIVDNDDIAPLLDNQHDDYKWFSVTDEALHPFIKSKISRIMKHL